MLVFWCVMKAAAGFPRRMCFCGCICSGSAVLARPALSDICHFVFSHNFPLVTEVCAVGDEGFVSLSVT